MPILKPFTPLKKKSRPAEKTLPPKKGLPARGKPAPKGKTQGTYTPPPARAPSWWERLSPERKLDVVGIILAFIGVLIMLGLLSANRSALVGGAIFFLSQIFGWGIYVLPLGLLVFGLWLVFRKIERIPPLSLERAVGSIILFLWLLTILHTVVATAETAESVALSGVGGGALGGIFQRLLWFGLGGVGAGIALFAWLIIGITVTLDISVQDLFRWLKPVIARLRMWLNKPLTPPSDPSTDPGQRLESAFVRTDGLTPIDPSIVQPVVAPVPQ